MSVTCVAEYEQPGGNKGDFIQLTRCRIELLITDCTMDSSKPNSIPLSATQNLSSIFSIILVFKTQAQLFK